MQRLIFADEHRNWSINRWKFVICSDECTFTTGKQRKVFVIRTEGERYCPDCLQHRYHSGRSSFTVWAAIGWDYKSELVFLDGHGARGGMSKTDYRDQVLVPHVAPFFAANEGKGYLYMEDGNKAHGLKNSEVKRWKEERGITCLEDWPPSSLDFNPIENIWRLLKQRLKSRCPFLDLQSLKNALQEEWDRLTQDEIRKYMISLPCRMEEALERNGLATRY